MWSVGQPDPGFHRRTVCLQPKLGLDRRVRPFVSPSLRKADLTPSRFILACHRGLAEDARALSCRYVIHEVCNAFVCLAVNIFRPSFPSPSRTHKP